jgi:selenocysteine lyase/cysteine desulfurase
VARACHAQDTLLLLDLSQCCGGMPLDLRQLGADFAVCAGYKWILSPYGTGFFWIRRDLIERLRPGPFYWMAIDGADKFQSLAFDNPRPALEARRWDAAETSSFFNLAAMDASLEFVLRLGPEHVLAHNQALVTRLFERLPEGCVPASPLDPSARGPFGCFAARSAEETALLYERLTSAKVVVSLREGNIRVSPHVYNDESEIDRLLAIVGDRVTA